MGSADHVPMTESPQPRFILMIPVFCIKTSQSNPGRGPLEDNVSGFGRLALS
jgi:hypothetical protein